MSVRIILITLIDVGKHAHCGWNHSLRLGSVMYKKENWSL